MAPMQLRLQFQRNEVADEVAAVTAVVRPILEGLLYALKREVADDAGGYEAIRLRSLPRLYRQGYGDCGICFEYAVHDALKRREETVLDVYTMRFACATYKGTSRHPSSSGWRRRAR
jgi:hypothetical protein